MDLDTILQSIDEEIERLQRAHALLTGHTAPLKLPVTPESQEGQRSGTGTYGSGPEGKMGQSEEATPCAGGLIAVPPGKAFGPAR